MCDASTIDYLRNGPVEAPLRIALAHGAGQGMDSDFYEPRCRGPWRHGV